MSDNVRNTNQRLKILYLYKILMECTDDDHQITMPEIIRKLEGYGISAARKALYEDIEALGLYGLDIISGRGAQSGYRVVNRDFQLPELKLLADAVSSSRFLTEKKSRELIAKIGTLTSVHEAKQLKRQVYIADRVKTINERIYLNVDALHRAIEEGKQVTFRYFKYNVQKKKVYGDKNRICSPYALIWEDERYYLVAHYDKYPEKLTNFRVDRMENVEILDEPAERLPENFNLQEYLGSTFSMFSGTSQTVKLRFENDLVNAVLDRFGKGVTLLPDGAEHFTVQVSVKAEQPFFGWLFGFGKAAQIVEPLELKNAYIQALKEAAGGME